MTHDATRARAETLMSHLGPEAESGSEWDNLSAGDSMQQQEAVQLCLKNQIAVLAAALGYPQGDAAKAKCVTIQRIARGRSVKPKIGDARKAAIVMQKMSRGHSQRVKYNVLRAAYPAGGSKFDLMVQLAKAEKKIEALGEVVKNMAPVLVPGAKVRLQGGDSSGRFACSMTAG